MAAVSWDGGAGADNAWTNPLNWSGDQVPGLNDDVTINVPGDIEVIVQGTVPQVASLVNEESIWVRGSNAREAGVLNVRDTTINRGTLRLESINSSWASGINTSGVLTNAAGGKLIVAPGSGGARRILGTLVNEGTLQVNPTTQLDVRQLNQFPFRVDLNGGVVDVQGGLVVQGGTLTWTGGAIDGDNFFGENTTWKIGDKVTDKATLRAVGNAGILQEHSAPTVTLQVNGRSGFGNGRLTMAEGVTNAGRLLLQSDDGGWESNLFLGTQGLVNTGVIESRRGTGGDRQITGTFTQRGTVDTQDYGINFSGRLQVDGGKFLGADNFLVRKTEINTLSPPSEPTRLRLRGAGNTLVSPGTATNLVLWVNGASGDGDGRLTLADGITNQGVILLESSDGGWESNVAAPQGFKNGSSGKLLVNRGTGGARRILGALVNEGTLQVNPSIQLDVQQLNQFPFQVDLKGGVVDAQSTLVVRGGAITWTGGAIDGDNFFGENTTWKIGDKVTDTATLRAVGNAGILQEHSAPTVTLQVNGRSGFGNGRLTMAEGVTNAGRLLLQSDDGGWESNLFLGTQGLVNTGMIESRRGTGGDRQITGTFTQRGTVDTQDYGINFSGRLQVDGGKFLGQGNFLIRNTEIATLSPPIEPTRLRLRGAGNTLVSPGTATNLVLWVNGASGDGDGRLTLADGITNQGVILLESSDGGWESNVAAPQGFKNGSSGRLQVSRGTGGARRILGALANEGTLQVNPGIQLDVQQLNQFPFQVDLKGGVIDAQSTLVVRGGTITWTGGAVDGDNFFGENTTWKIGDKVTDTATLRAVGNAGILQEHAAPTVTLQVNGRNGFGNAKLTAADGITNAGRILLQSDDGGWESNLFLRTQGLINAGVIESRRGTGGDRQITGTFTQRGIVDTQEYGINFSGRLQVDGGKFLGADNFQIRNTEINTLSPPSEPTRLRLRGAGNTLVNPGTATNLVLWVNGSSGDQNGRLTLSEGVVNQGVILLESSDGGWESNLFSATGINNGINGRIEVSRGTGGDRNLLGSLTNSGTINIAANTGLTVRGDVVTVLAGNINAQGPLTFRQAQSPQQPVFNFEIRGTQPRVDFGQITAAQGLNLATRINTTFAASFSPAASDVFPLFAVPTADHPVIL